MGIHWALPILESLLPDDLRDRWKEAYVDPTVDFSDPKCKSMQMYNGVTGELMKEIVVPGTMVRVSRRRLRAFLSQQIDVQVRTFPIGHEATT